MSDDLNQVTIRGSVVSAPRHREMPAGVHTNVEFKAGEMAVPVVFLERTDLLLGERYEITGYVQRRFFRAGGVTHSRTEVVAQTCKRAN